MGRYLPYSVISVSYCLTLVDGEEYHLQQLVYGYLNYHITMNREEFSNWKRDNSGTLIIDLGREEKSCLFCREDPHERCKSRSDHPQRAEEN